jgi:hypothetical protein
MKRQTHHVVVIAALVFAVLSGIPMPCDLCAAAADGRRTIEYSAGLLSLEARQRPILALLKEIAQVAGIEIVLFDPINPAPVDAGMENRPLDQALGAILKGCNYAVIYDSRPGTAGIRFLHGSNRYAAHDGERYSPASAGKDGIEGSSSARARQASGLRDGGWANGTEMSGEKHPGVTTVTSLAGQEPSVNKRVETASAGFGTAGAGPLQDPSQPVRVEQADTPESPVIQPGASPPSNRRLTAQERLKRLIATYEERIASGQSDRDYEMAMELSGGGYEIQHDRDRVQFWQEALQRHSEK